MPEPVNADALGKVIPLDRRGSGPTSVPDPEPRPGLPGSPLEPAPEPVGFRWG